MNDIIEKYSWDIDSFKRRYDEVMKILLEETLTKKKENEYNCELDTLELLLNTINDDNSISLPYLFLKTEKINDEIKKIISKKSNNFQRSIIIESSKVFRGVKTNLIDYKSLEKSIPLQTQMKLIIENFNFKSKLKSEHIKLLNSASKQLQFFRNKDENSFVFYNNIGYIANKNNETLSDFCNLCHEIGHYDEVLETNNRLSIEYDIKHNYRIWLYVEVYSLFYELLSVHFLNKEKLIDENEKSNIFNDIFDSCINQIDQYLLGLNIFYKNKPSLYQLAKLRFSKGFENSNRSLYYYSYLIAVNLFEQFLKDEQRALYNLNYLVNNITPENEKQVLNYTDTNPEDLSSVLSHIKMFTKTRNN